MKEGAEIVYLGFVRNTERLENLKKEYSDALTVRDSVRPRLTKVADEIILLQHIIESAAFVKFSRGEKEKARNRLVLARVKLDEVKKELSSAEARFIDVGVEYGILKGMIEIEEIEREEVEQR